MHLCYFESTYLFSPGDQGLQKPHAWALCSAAQVTAALSAQQAAHSWEIVLAPSNSNSYHLLTTQANTTWPFLRATDKKCLSAYMTACQLNSSYIINNLSSPLHLSCTWCPCLFLQHSRHLYAKHDLCSSTSTVRTNPLCSRNMVHACDRIRWAFNPPPGKVAKAEAPGDRAAGKPVGKVEEKTIRSTAPQPPTLPDTSLSKSGLRDHRGKTREAETGEGGG